MNSKPSATPAGPGDHSVAAGIASDPSACYRALVSHDARFDGQFFVGVSSTGIYCRPVCRVRVPRAKNCTFFSNAPAAEAAGFRPCLRCRPELAPGWSGIDISSSLAINAARLIEEGLHRGTGVADVAERLGVSDRHLRRIFEREFGMAPVRYLQSQRLLLAKRLLTDTSLPIAQVAGAAGFGSLRRLNASMQASYNMRPSDLRAGRVRRTAQTEAMLTFQLPVREPYDFSWMHGFFASRALGQVESIHRDSYERVLHIDAEDGPRIGWFSIRQAKPGQLELKVSMSLSAVVAPVLAQVRRLFDLDADPAAYLPALGPLADANPGLRVPGAASGFEIAVRAVLGQQVTVKAARTLTERFVQRFGQPCEFADNPRLSRAFPTPAKIARVRTSSIASLGIISRRAQTIQQLARGIGQGNPDLSGAAPVDAVLAQLLAQPGIGDWTAQYIAMRCLRWPDAFPAADYGVMKALDVKTAAAARSVAEQWRPWRAYAVMHLWQSLHAQSGVTSLTSNGSTHV